ncbi:MAG TPA: methyl-accepting chemotaxis protein [Leptospiraceae bacterium]|nr:methyl-accepting chemotaxis protein [Leptospiraceae bacterium]HRG76600.1 methyl-accepting chemotaxis protein [Leptospiraceae bacterium]
MSGVMEAVAAGNLKIRVSNFDSKAENSIDKLFRNVNQSLDSLKELLGMIKGSAETIDLDLNSSLSLNEKLVNKMNSLVQSSDGISNLSRSISVNANDTSLASTSNMSTLQVLTQELNSLSGNIGDMNQNTNELVKLSRDINTLVESGKLSMQAVNSAMTNITNSSKNITNVVIVIKEISERVNLLSLNASIEAARAGQYGRGFAIVAGEVSKLADQTASSIKEIEENIKVNSREISENKIRIDETNRIFSEIISQIETILQTIYRLSDIIARLVTIRESLISQYDEMNDKAKGIHSQLMEQKQSSIELTKSSALISSTYQEINKEMEIIYQSTQKVRGISEELHDVVSIFKI